MADTQTSSGAIGLYDPAILARAVELADYRWSGERAQTAQGRSRTCGSTVGVELDVRSDGTVGQVGLKVHACALGQASAAVMAGDIEGRTQAQIAKVAAAISSYFDGSADDLTGWKGIEILKVAKEYPARHPAILLPFQTAVKALDGPSVQDSGAVG